MIIASFNLLLMLVCLLDLKRSFAVVQESARHASLLTVWGEHLSNNTRFLPHPKHPRPQLTRPGFETSSTSDVLVKYSWISLNGFWDYSVTTVGEASSPAAAAKLGWAGKIRVPFPLESHLANVGGHRQLEPGQYLWYRRSFRVGSPAPTGPKASRLRYFLNFEAVDYACVVWVNGVAVGGHRGGSTPFRLEVHVLTSEWAGRFSKIQTQ